MKRLENIPFPLYTPNLVNICIDAEINGEMTGRIYHCYDKEPWEFAGIVKMMEKMDQLFDLISFPQAAMESRSFGKTEKKKDKQLYKEETPEHVAANRGEKNTFLVYVQYRQNSSWQGVVKWVESDRDYQFCSELELLKIITNVLENIS